VYQLMAAGGEKRVDGSATREIREEWPLLTVETEGKWGVKEYKRKGSLQYLIGGALARRAGTIDFCPALAALVGPVQNIIFLPYTICIICPHHPASWAGSHAGSPVS
jgi:hypothetical protein